VRRGLAATTLTDVAEEAGQPRSLVRYFLGNRDATVTGLIERMLARGEAQLETLQAADHDPDAAAMVDLLLDHMFADPTTNVVMMELWHLAIRDEDVRERLASIYRRIASELAAWVFPDVRGHDKKLAFDAALAAVSMALGAAFFAHLGLAPHSRANLRGHAARAINPAPSELRPSRPKTRARKPPQSVPHSTNRLSKRNPS
jgi:AcrR family transcriptional regulator